MDANPKFGELRHRAAHVHNIAAEPIEFGDNQHVTGFEAIEEAREPAALCGSDIAGDCLGDHTPGLDLEAGGRELLDGSDAFEIAGADLPLTVLKIPFSDARAPSTRCLRKRSKPLPTAGLIAT